MKICTFCGHAKYPYGEYRGEMLKILEELIIKGDVATFYLGGYGDYDRFCDSCVAELQRKYPSIKRILILAYLPTKPRDPEYTIGQNYDGTIYPPLEGALQRFAITYRNKWMVDNSDYIVSGVLLSYGKSLDTLRYAQSRGKAILSLPQTIRKPQ